LGLFGIDRDRSPSLVAAALVAGLSLAALLIWLAAQDCGAPDPLWLWYGLIALCALAAVWLISELVINRALAVPVAIAAHFGFGVLGWGISNLFFAGSENVQPAVVWIPLWVVGVIVGSDLLATCGD